LRPQPTVEELARRSVSTIEQFARLARNIGDISTTHGFEQIAGIRAEMEKMRTAVEELAQNLRAVLSITALPHATGHPRLPRRLLSRWQLGPLPRVPSPPPDCGWFGLSHRAMHICVCWNGLPAWLRVRAMRSAAPEPFDGVFLTGAVAVLAGQLIRPAHEVPRHKS
jgi:hypothetical protein